jgi:ribosomal protein L35AE/L33A
VETHGISLDRFFADERNTANDRDRSFLKATIEGGVRVRKEEVVHINGFSSDLDCEVCKNADIQKVIDDNAGEVTITVPIKNTDRSVGAMLSGNIARAHGNNGFKGQISVQFEGSAGQSFGASFTLLLMVMTTSPVPMLDLSLEVRALLVMRACMVQLEETSMPMVVLVSDSGFEIVVDRGAPDCRMPCCCRPRTSYINKSIPNRFIGKTSFNIQKN